MEKAGSKTGYILAVIGLVILIQNKYIFSSNPVVIFIQLFSVVLIRNMRHTRKKRKELFLFYFENGKTVGGWF